MTFCAQCPVGFMTLDSGNAKCQLCLAGRYGVNRAQYGFNCRACDAGLFRSPTKENAFECDKCDLGLYQEETGQPNCLVRTSVSLFDS